VTRSPRRRAAWSRTSTASPSAGAASTDDLLTHDLLTHASCATTGSPGEGREEDKADDTVWAVTCFVTRAGYRTRGVAYALARATVDFARERGARALEGYPMLTTPGQDITWGDVHVGSRSIFDAEGFAQVSHPTPRRVVMRIDF
jgi:GNAT superfamily N-acetyltransferase